MKYLISIILALLIIPALLPSQFTVEREITINDTQGDVFSYLVNLDAWQEWSPWLSQEPTADYSFQGIPGVVGSSTQWKGKIIGSGKQTLTKIEEPQYLETKLEFFEPQESTATGYFKIIETAQGVKVIWGITGASDYPIGRVFGLFMDSMIGKDFETGLKSLKEKLENSSPPTH